MTEPSSSAGYFIKIDPKEWEMNLIARGRQLHGIYPVDFDAKIIWIDGKPEYLNGKPHASIERQNEIRHELELPFPLPLDT